MRSSGSRITVCGVDLQNARLERSFGTALKLGSRSNLPGTITLYVADFAMVIVLLNDQR